MAKRVPTSCTQFLEQVAETFMAALAKRPELRDSVSGIRPVGNHAVAADSGLAKDLRWVFRPANSANGHLDFCIECTPKRALGIGESVLVEAHKEAGLRGSARVEGGKLIFSLGCGHESQAHQLADGGLVNHNIREFAIQGMLRMLGILQQYGQSSVVGLVETIHPSASTGTDRPVTDQLRISLERHLEELIVEQWNDIDWGADLEYVDRQVPCGEIGIIDILARDCATGGHVIFELKRDQSDDQTFGQLARYMGWVDANMPQPSGVVVQGIIIAATATAKLRSAATTNPSVRVLQYGVRLILVSGD